MQITGQSWLVLTLTNSPFKLGLVSTLQWTPVLVLSLFAGVIADRFPKRKILIATQSSMAFLALVLAFLTLTGRVQYWHVLVTATLVGAVQAFDMPTRQAFVVEMTSKEDLLNAIALNSSIFNLARVVGPSLAGILIKYTGTGWAFFINGLSFFGVIYAFATMKVPDRVRPRGRSAVSEIRAGLSYIRRTPSILGLMILLGIIAMFALNFNILVPTLTRIVLHGDSSHYGFLMSAMGAGALLGSILLATFGGRGPRMKSILAGAIVLGLGEVSLLFVRGWTLSAMALFACGAAMVTFSASANTTIQVSVPDELRGRVMSVYSLVFGGGTPIGAFVAGTLAQNVGTSATFGIVGGIALATTLVMHLAHKLPAPPEQVAEPPAEALARSEVARPMETDPAQPPVSPAGPSPGADPSAGN